MFGDELLSHFCERPSIWSDKQNTPCLGFVKGLRFLNMVMTFTLIPLSHYNSITRSRVDFLLSLLEDLSIDFPSHFITSILDVYQDKATRDKLIFLSAIMWFSDTFPSPFLTLLNLPPWLPSTPVQFGGVRPSFEQSNHEWSRMLLWLLLFLPPSRLLPPLLLLC